MVRLAAVLGGLVVLGLAATPGAARQPASDPTALKRQADERIRELQAEADSLATRSQTLLGGLRRLELEREIRAQAVAKADAELAEVTAALDAADDRVNALEARRLAETPDVSARLVEIYKRGRAGYVRLLLASDDLQALGRLTRGVAAMARLDRVRVEEHRRTLDAERRALADLEARRTALKAAQADAEAARRSLETAIAAQSRRIDELDSRRDLTARYVGELQAATASLQRHVAGLSPDTPATLPLPPFRGALDWPVVGRVVSRFGRSSDTRLGTTVVRNGIEIAAPGGPDVRAVHGGTVEYAAPFVGYGTLVILNHGDNAFTLYGHLREPLVGPGAFVERGSTVGRAGRNPEGVEVAYFELRIDGRPVDPVQWLRSSR